MARIRIIQVKSKIKRPKNQKATLETLGLRRINHAVEHDTTPSILGMIRTVRHLVEVQEL